MLIASYPLDIRTPEKLEPTNFDSRAVELLLVHDVRKIHLAILYERAPHGCPKTIAFGLNSTLRNVTDEV